MDPRYFDTLTRALSATDSRRRLLGALAALPVVGGIMTLLEPEDAAGKDRRRRRKQRHKRRKQPGKRKGPTQGKGCEPQPVAKLCAGTCGPVTNRCNQTIDCGPCSCNPACPTCQTCDPSAGTCIPDSTKLGDGCGSPGQVCQADGACACDATSCAPCEVCGPGGTCAGCAACCAGGICQDGEAHDACGSSGECAQCGVGEICYEQACCVPATCQSLGKTCGSWPDGCGGTLNCGGCGIGASPACDDGTCTSCAAVCGVGCDCFGLADGSTQCGSGDTTQGSCVTCTTNADCDADRTCTSTFTGRSGSTTLPSLCGFPDTVIGNCIKILPC